MADQDLKFELAHCFTWPPQNSEFLRFIGFPFVLTSATALQPVTVSQTACRKEFLSIMRALCSNIGNTQAMLMMPRDIFSNAQMFERAALHVLTDPLLKDSKNAKTYEIEYYNLKEKVFSGENLRFSGYGDRQFAIATTEFPRFSASLLPHLRIGLQNLLRASLLNAWTAFENLAADLWIKAVDLRPRTLAYNVVMGPKPSNPNSKQEPQMPFREMADFGFNVSNDMGKLLKNRGKVNLDSLERIEEAYFCTFSDLL